MTLQRALAWIIGFSAAVSAFLFWLIYFSPLADNTGLDVSYLAGVNAFLNACAAAAIGVGFCKIRKKNIAAHKRAMLTAFGFSTLFFISYLTYHTFHGDVRFTAEGVVRYVYFPVLISHIVLSVIALPLILVSFFLSLSDRIPYHRMVSRITLPVWLYVSVTGVLVYVMQTLFNQ